MYSPEVQMKIEEFRRKSIDGTLTQDEMREAILLLRSSRKMAQTISQAKKKTAARSADILLDGLLDL